MPNGPALFYEDARCERLRDDVRLGPRQAGRKRATSCSIDDGGVAMVLSVGPTPALISPPLLSPDCSKPHVAAGLQELPQTDALSSARRPIRARGCPRSCPPSHSKLQTSGNSEQTIRVGPRPRLPNCPLVLI